MEMSIARRGISSGRTRSGGEPMSTNVNKLTPMQIDDEAFMHELGVKCPPMGADLEGYIGT